MKPLFNRKIKENNYLDYVPVHNPLFSYTLTKNGRVRVKVRHKGMFHRMAQIFFGRPECSYIELDELGSFVWQQMDGKRSIYAICILMRDRFGERAEPLFERAVSFFRILRSNAFIVYENKR